LIEQHGRNKKCLIFPIYQKESEDKCKKYKGKLLLPQRYKILSSG
jgi:hypothetical protein